MNLIQLIINMFSEYCPFLFIKSNNKEYSYREIFEYSKRLSTELNLISNSSLRIGLIGDNSVEWIIAFFGIIFSRHIPVLISKKLPFYTIQDIVIRENLDIVISDFKININNYPLIQRWILLDEITNYRCGDFLVTQHKEKSPEILVIITPNQNKQVIITYNQIESLLKELTKKSIFKQDDNYITNLEFTYNYILGLLLPFLYGGTIIVSNSSFISNYYLSNLKWGLNTSTICITAHEFELSYKKCIDIPTDWLLNFLSKWRLWFIKRWIIKKRLNKIFPNLKKLIIVNSSLSYKTELALKNAKFPYTITYGTIETMGLASYSDPKDFVFGSVGKLLPHADESPSKITEDDILKIKNKGNLYFYHRRGEELTTDYGYIISRKVEDILKGLPYVIDCLLIMSWWSRNPTLNLIVSVDKEVCDYYRITREELQDLLNNSIKKINQKSYQQEKINRVIILYDDFIRDSYDRIIKKFYRLE
jgi:hypothetical protein